MITVLFACVRNAGRSQIAAALFNQLAPPGLRAISAGTDPADHIHPEVITAMAEVGVDLAGAVPQRLTHDLAARADLLVTMGCGEQCPVVPVPRRDWPLPDPAGQPLPMVRAVRDDIHQRVARLVAELPPQASARRDQQARLEAVVSQRGAPRRGRGSGPGGR